MKKFVRNSLDLIKKDSMWAVPNQLLVSGGNFIVNIILARSLPSNEYGNFVFFYVAVLFLNTLHSALIITPLSIEGASKSKRKWKCYTSIAILITLLTSIPFSIFIIIAAFFMGMPYISISVIVALIFGQLQETTRRSFMAQFEFGRSTIGDIFSYIGQASVVFFISKNNQLSINTAFLSIGLTSLTGFLLQLIQLKLKLPNRKEIFLIGGNFIKLGRWLFLTNLIRTLPSQLILWILVIFHGATAVANQQAVANLISVTNPIIFSIQNLILPLTSRAYAEGGFEKAQKVVWKTMLKYSIMLLPYILLLLILPGTALTFYYGTGTSYMRLAFALQLFAIAHIVFILTIAPQTLLNAVRQSKLVLIAEIVPIITTLIIVIPLIIHFGFIAAIWGTLILGVVRLITILMFVKKLNYSKWNVARFYQNILQKHPSYDESVDTV